MEWLWQTELIWVFIHILHKEHTSEYCLNYNRQKGFPFWHFLCKGLTKYLFYIHKYDKILMLRLNLEIEEKSDYERHEGYNKKIL